MDVLKSDLQEYRLDFRKKNGIADASSYVSVQGSDVKNLIPDVQRKRRLEDVSQKASGLHQRLKATKFSNSSGKINEIPYDSSLINTNTSGNRFAPRTTNGQKVLDVRQRPASLELLNFLVKLQNDRSDGRSQSVYIHGPQGVGKSHSLFQTVMFLRQDDNNRVIYFQDCSVWACQNEVVAWMSVQDQILYTFPNDPEIIEYCKELKDNQIATLLLLVIPDYCKKKGYSLYAIFDQHNGIPAISRNTWPWVLPISISTQANWSEALVVISASANNEYRLKIAQDARWPQYIFNQGYEEDVWKEIVAYEPSLKDDAVRERLETVSGRIPLDIDFFLRIAKHSDHANKTPKEILIQYELERREQFQAQDIYFWQHQGTFYHSNQTSAAIQYMGLGLPIPADVLVAFNEQLMYWAPDNTRVLLPLNQIARQVLLGSKPFLDYTTSRSSDLGSSKQHPLSDSSD